ncbi:hypothetical protein H4219_005858 [Mycoemilia scoparia]|uniref:Secreted protein n=1 Tax=Mycoemilia scoparia TaxID=417184 RepID=A0A9W7ZMP6_9FUNG|nr:hypothetical protein H4219_005858 [Mycoemilia scoparia]
MHSIKKLAITGTLLLPFLFGAVSAINDDGGVAPTAPEYASGFTTHVVLGGDDGGDNTQGSEDSEDGLNFSPEVLDKIQELSSAIEKNPSAQPSDPEFKDNLVFVSRELGLEKAADAFERATEGAKVPDLAIFSLIQSIAEHSPKIQKGHFNSNNPVDVAILTLSGYLSYLVSPNLV